MAISRREGSLLLLLTVVVITLTARRTEAIANIDTMDPIIRYSPALGEEDFFGYAVVLHQVATGTPGDFDAAISNTRIIVGAPKGTFPGGLDNLAVVNSSQAENETGLVYQCPLNPGICGPVGRSADPGIFDRRLYDDQPDNTSLRQETTISGEQKRGQLMGQTLRSSGGVFVACAPRWIAHSLLPRETIDNRRSLGRCFASGRDLTNFIEVRPCTGESNTESRTTSGTNRCQAGFGAELFVDGTTTRLLVSGLGSYNARGATFLYNDIVNSVATNDSGLADESTGEPSGIYTRASLYDGWSVTTGSILSQTTASYITGMPRFDGQTYRGKINIRDPNDLTTILDTADVGFADLVGVQMGEYFGHAVVSADLNNDGWDEIIVGAPMYSGTPMNRQPEKGRVYIFKNEMGTVNRTPIILERDLPFARFGHSIVGVGDVNDDGYNDIAIGAPYYNNTRSPNVYGTVFIYYGSADYIDTFPSQVISARSVLEFLPNVNNLTTFGFSLSSGVDVDANLYNDLVVGAYGSQAAVLFRTLSVARINFNITTDVDSVALTGTNPQFVTSVCASFDGRGLSGRPLDISFTLTEDRLRQDVSRVIFEGANPDSFTGFLNFTAPIVQVCRNVSVEVKPITSLPNNIDLRDPIVVRVIFNQLERASSLGSGNLIDLRDFPLLRPSGDATTSVTPNLGCGVGSLSNEVCRPDLTVVISTVNFRAGSSVLPDRNSIVAGEVTAVQFLFSVANIADDPAVNSVITFSLPPTAPFFIDVQTPSGQEDVSCTKTGVNDEYRCNLRRFIDGGETVSNIQIDWIVDSSKVTGFEPDVFASFRVGLVPDSSDMEVDPSNNLVSSSIVVEGISPLRIDSVVFEVAPATYDNDPPPMDSNRFRDLGPSIELTAKVINGGPSTVPRARLDFYVPTIAVEGPTRYYYMYVGRVSSEALGTTRVVCSQEFVNPDMKDLSENARRKRSRFSRQADGPGSIARTVNCANTTHPSCQNFQCSITDFDQEFQVRVFAVLDSRFYMSQDSDFVFQAFARVEALDGYDIFDVVKEDNMLSSAEYVLRPVPPPPINIYLEIWLPIICAIVALILIIVVFVALFYCGFFRRRKIEKAKREAAEGGEFEVRQVPPEAPAVITGEDPETKDKSDLGDGVEPADEPAAAGGQQPADEKTDVAEEGIGDASDLHDGEIADPDQDAEETSL